MASISPQTYDEIDKLFNDEAVKRKMPDYMFNTIKSIIEKLKRLIPYNPPRLSFSEWNDNVYLTWPNCVISFLNDKDRDEWPIPYVRYHILQRGCNESNRKDHDGTTYDTIWSERFYYNLGHILNLH